MALVHRLLGLGTRAFDNLGLHSGIRAVTIQGQPGPGLYQV